jgi:hypothetical protein
VKTSRTRFARAISLSTATALLALTALVFGEGATTPSARADDAAVTLQWQKTLTTGSAAILGGAGVGNLDGNGPALIVGDRAGWVFALHTDGSTVPGFPYKADGGIESTPAVSGSNTGARIYIGVGTSSKPSAGGYLKLSNRGKALWEAKTYLLPGKRGGTRGVMGSLAVGPIQTASDVVGGAMGQMQLAIATATGKTLPGFPWLEADTNFSSPALAPLYGSRQDHIIEGGDSTKGVAGTNHYVNGGHIRILRPTGSKGYKHANDGLSCQYNTNQVVQSSPAVGNFLSNGKTIGIVVGTGTYYKSQSDTNDIIAVNTACKLQWKTKLDGNTLPSPALADVDGIPSTSPDVVTESGAGTLYVLNGTTGAVRWAIPFGGGAQGSVTTFKDPSGNFQDIVVPTGGGVYLVNGLTHSYTKISSLHAASPTTETVDADGRIGITVVGYNSGNTGVIQHFTVNGYYPSPSTIATPGAWPMFHHDPQLDGYVSDLPVTTP